MDDHDDGAVGPVPLSLLADLQAGLLDDDTAARVRHLARTDPTVAGQLAALDQVRRDVAALGVDAASAPEVPATVTARVSAALRALPPPTAARTRVATWRRAAAGTGILAAVAAVGVGSAVLIRGGIQESPASTATAAAARAGGIGLSDGDVLALLDRPVELGQLAAPARFASCLSGLGYPTSASALGARAQSVGGRPGVLILLPGDLPGRIDAVVVAPNCSSIDTGLLASTSISRP